MTEEYRKRQREYQAKYNAANTTRIYVKLNNKTDKDIIDFLDTVENRQGLVKELLRDHMYRGKA